MNMLTITDLTRQHGISTRTLRYYEELGLISSIRSEDYAYRMYDEVNCKRVMQIVLLRKLRIPTKQIAQLLSSDDTQAAINLFAAQVGEIDNEMDALKTLRGILTTLITKLHESGAVKLSNHLVSDKTLTDLIVSVKADAKRLKEVQSMGDLSRAEGALNKLRNVRIVYLPPATVAAAHFIGDNPEDVAGKWIDEFAIKENLIAKKPDVRIFGFNHPNPCDETGYHGYEFYVTIPDDMQVPEPLVKKHFEGGQYAAHCIKMGDFHEWAWLDDWTRTNGEYEYRGDNSPENMFGSLEEHLDAFTYFKNGAKTNGIHQLDLLIPVRKKEG